MNILVTGGAGFIGSNLCEKAINLGHRVICIDNFNNYYNPLIKERNISKLINNDNFILYNCDILDLLKIEEVFSKNKIDLVIHLAARTGVRPSIENALLYETVNVQGTINILDKCRHYGILNFIFASSSSVYGGNTKVPFSESDNVDHPISPYAATKKAGELICYSYSYLFGMSIYCYRFFTVYGPGQRPEMAIHKFTRQILNEQKIDLFGDGDSSRDYTYIDDIINVITDNLENIKGFEIINLGNSKPVRLLELVSIIEKITKKKALLNYSGYQQGDVFKTCADILKAKKMLKYSPETDIEQGIRKFVSWYIETREQNKLFED
jgi:UDP-glucuronate 4-epimerase